MLVEDSVSLSSWVPVYIDSGSVLMVEVTDSWKLAEFGLIGQHNTDSIFSEISTEGAKTHNLYSQLTSIG